MSNREQIKYTLEYLLCFEIGMDIPSNFEDILSFIEEDVVASADPIHWHNGDVVIGFRRWIESQSKNN